MRKTQKKVLGLFGLVFVAAMTCFAAILPVPETSAVSTSSVTDTITLRIVGAVPDVEINAPENEKIFIDPECDIELEYENVETLIVELKYTDLDGNEITEIINTSNPDYVAGTSTLSLNLDNYGYGDYVITATGVGFDNVKDIEYVEFSYLPIYTEIEEDPNTGLVYLILHYRDDVIGSADIDVYLGDQHMVPPSTIKITSPTHRVEIPFDGLPTGTYTIKTTGYAYDTGEKIGRVFENEYYYESIPIPDTGGLFKGGNISKEDYIITGTIAFLAFSGIAIWIVAKGRKDNKRRNRR